MSNDDVWFILFDSNITIVKKMESIGHSFLTFENKLLNSFNSSL
jgi:hypothetical protein